MTPPIVSESDGYQVLTDGNTGKEIARVRLPGQRVSDLSGGVSTKNYVTGNCGVSYFYLYDNAGDRFHIRTGFDVDGNASDFTWRTTTIGTSRAGTDNWEWGDDGPKVPGPVWTSGNRYSTQDAPSGTYYYGRVTRGNAILTDGRVCNTGYPNAGLTLYK